jgi:hypothetical protein
MIPLCVLCTRFNGDGTCEAFKSGIPDDIILGKFDHHNAYDGDNGLRFNDSVIKDNVKLNYKCDFSSFEEGTFKCGDTDTKGTEYKKEYTYTLDRTKKEYPNATFKLEGIHPSKEALIAEVLEKFAWDYPLFANSLKEVSILPANMTARNADYAPQLKRLRIPTSIREDSTEKDWESYATTVKKQTGLYPAPPGSNSEKASIFHELGHHIYNSFDWTKEQTKIYDDWRKESLQFLGNNSSTKDLGSQLLTFISDKKDEEIFAQAFAIINTTNSAIIRGKFLKSFKVMLEKLNVGAKTEYDKIKHVVSDDIYKHSSSITHISNRLKEDNLPNIDLVFKELPLFHGTLPAQGRFNIANGNAYIQINPNIFNSEYVKECKDRWNSLKESEYGLRWTFAADATNDEERMRYIADHEIGHLAMDTYIRRKGWDRINAKPGETILSDIDWNVHYKYMAGIIEEEDEEAEENNEDPTPRDGVPSAYALSSPGEWFAETYVAVKNGLTEGIDQESIDHVNEVIKFNREFKQ